MTDKGRKFFLDNSHISCSKEMLTWIFWSPRDGCSSFFFVHILMRNQLWTVMQIRKQLSLKFHTFPNYVIQYRFRTCRHECVCWEFRKKKKCWRKSTKMHIFLHLKIRSMWPCVWKTMAIKKNSFVYFYEYIRKLILTRVQTLLVQLCWFVSKDPNDLYIRVKVASDFLQLRLGL